MDLLKKDTAKMVLAAALSTGGDFAEIFIENTVKNNILLINGKVDKVLSGVDYGLGIRIFNGYGAIYVYTNDTSDENLLLVAKEAAQAISKAGKNNQVMDFTKKNINQLSPILKMPGQTSKKDILAFLREGAAAAANYNAQVTQTNVSYRDVVQEVLIINSEGLWANDSRTRTHVGFSSIASNESEKQTGSISVGQSKGSELLEEIDICGMARTSAESAVTMLNADLCPSGKMPVIMDNGFGGVIFHEACGHSLEATSVAKGASVFAGKLNEPIASKKVTAIDDGTIKNGWGSINMDDEGNLSRKNVLIENGILKSYMIDRLNGLRMGMEATGSSRRESYRFAPTSRMTNTYILNGSDTKEDIFSSTKYGLYAKRMGGGSVQPATGDFNFAVTEAYLVENGKITTPVRGATLIGKGSEILKNIDMVSDNMDMEPGMCGSISGSVPTNCGQPMLRVQDIAVGGRK